MRYNFRPTFTCEYSIMDSTVALNDVRTHLSFYLTSELNKLQTEKEANRLIVASDALRRQRIMERFDTAI